MVATNLMANPDRDVLSKKSSENMIYSIDDFKLGMRISSGEDIGTIRYIGSIEGYNGNWLGIDWDCPTRGKHNGSVHGNIYFNASHETSGSFVRPFKVNLGVSIADALRGKYGEVTDAEKERLIQERLESVSKSINAPFLELVGFGKLEKKQSDFKELRIVGLRELQINDLGDLKEFSRLCPNVIELDLSKNLITSWDTIIEICKDLPFLRRLNVSENKLELPVNIGYGALSQIKTIICGDMNVTWHNIVYLSQMWPNIEELRIPFNNITNLDTTFNLNYVFLKLSTIFLQSNPIQSWHEINKLGTLNTLKKLILTECNLCEIEFPDCLPTEKSNLFKNLQCLSIAENLIDNWKSISELEKLRSLTELRCTKNPIDSTETTASCFQLIVARIGNLKNLNGTELHIDDRRGAEYDYMKKYANEWHKCQNDNEKMKDFVSLHPRFPILVEKYGSPDKITKTVHTSLKSNLLELEFINEDKKIIKKIPPGMLVDKLTTLIQRLFKLDSTPKLYYVSSTDENNCERNMDNNLKDLQYYSIQSGDRIYIRTE
ncbi:tubulin-specific chaperone E [Chrysoperla carnea]|uniref:tubulin-specific chaperone E n=1 Tax=Chrysoperla carnea TaxID=189513 RepID=UPI001D08B35A|nr:tubulin-specific chaperone E [Chrysoperla carnea]